MSVRSAAGNTILVSPGTYREQVTVAGSGTASNPLVIQAAGPGVKVYGSTSYGSPAQWTLSSGTVYRASSVTADPVVVVADGDHLKEAASSVTPAMLPAGSWKYVSGQGLYVNLGGPNPGDRGTEAGARSYGFRLDRRSFVTVKGFEVRYVTSRNVYLTGPLNSTIIEGCRLTHGGKNGLAAVNCSSIVVRDNTVSYHLDHGIMFQDVEYSTVDGNEGRDNYRPATRAANGMYLTGSSNNLIKRNSWHHNQDSGINFTGDSEFNLCINNLYYKNGDHGADHLDSGSGNVHIGDVAYYNFKDGFSIEGDSPNHKLYNCIGFDNGFDWDVEKRFDLFVDPPSSVGYQGDYNIFWKSRPGLHPIKFNGTRYASAAEYFAATGREPHTRSVNPMVADTANGDFRPIDGSPLIDAGTSAVPGWPSTDLDGNPRNDDPATPNTGAGPVGYSEIGAYEFAPNAPPVARVTVDPDNGIPPLPVIVSGATSTDEGTIVSYTFDFGDGTVVGPQASPTANHTYQIGEWALTLSVVDNRGGVDSASVPVVVTANLVGNPSFETIVTGWAPTSGSTLTRVSGGQDGAFSAQVQGPAAGTATFALNDSPNWINVTDAVNTRYRFTAWVRSLTHTGRIKLQVREFNNGVLQATSQTAEIPLTTSWQLISVDHLSRMINSTLDLQVVNRPNVSGETFQVDNVTARVVQLDRAPAVTAPPTAVATELEPLIFQITALDPDGEPVGLAADFTGLPAAHNATFTPDPSNTSGTFTWTPTFQDARPAPYPVIFRASNTLIGADTTLIAVNDVDPFPVVVAPDTVSAQEGTAVSFQVTASDPDGSAITTLAANFANLPAGHNATFTAAAGNASGTFTWTPSFTEAPGSYQVIFTAANTSSASDTATITVANVDLPPVILAPATFVAGEGAAGVLTFTVADPDSQPIDSLHADLSGLPAGSNAVFSTSANHRTATLTWTPAPGTPPGPHRAVFTAGNALVARDTTDITVDRKPMVTAPGAATVGETLSLSIAVSVADADGDPITALTADLSNLPVGHNAVFTPNASNTSGTLTWTPTSSDGRGAPYAVSFTASSDMLSGTATTSITVDQPPVVAAATTVTVTETNLLSVAVTATDPDGQSINSLTANVSGLPAGHDAMFTVAPDQRSGTLTWTPTAADGRNAPYAVTFTASNVLAGASTTTITVDQPPLVTTPNATEAIENAAVTVNVEASDPDGQGIASLTANLSGLPAGHNAAFTPGAGNTSGTLTWTPTFDDSGTFVITFTASNLLASGSAIATIHVSNVDRAPVLIAAPTTSVGEGELLSSEVTAVDPDGDAIAALTADLSGLPAGHGAVFTPAPGNASGTLTWTPNIGDGALGPYAVAYTAANALTAQASTSITVDRHPIVTVPVDATVTENDEIVVHVTATDPDGQAITSLTADLSVLPAGHGAVFTPGPDNTSGTLVWTPSYFAAPGPYLIRFTANNGIAGSATTSIAVTNHDRAPVLECPAVAMGGERNTISMVVTAVDPDLEPITSLTADLATLPIDANAIFTTAPDLSSGTLSWTPVPGDGDASPYIVSFMASNARQVANATAILVDRYPRITVAATASVQETSTVVIPVTVADPDLDEVLSLTADLSELPPGHNATFTASPNNLSGTLLWTPTYDDARGAPYRVRFIATNALSETTSTDVTVISRDRAPVVTLPPTTIGGENSQIVVNVAVTDPESDVIDSLTADLSELPSGHDATFTPAGNNTSGVFRWTPSPSEAPGPYTIVFTGTANGLSTRSSTSITVDRHPILTAPATVNGAENAPLTVDVTVTEPDLEAIASLTADLSALPAGHDAVFIPAADRRSATLTWTPSFNDAGGPYPVVITASNALSTTATVQLSVANVDRAPVVTSTPSLLVAENVQLTTIVSVSDPDGDPIASLTADLSALPAGHDGVFTPNATHTSGTLTWKPRNGDARLQTYDVVFQAANAMTGDDTTAIKVDQRPVVTVTPTSLTAGEGTLVTLDVAVSDPDGQPITLLVANLNGLPTGHNATFTISADKTRGTFTWTPTYSDFRVTPFTVTFTATNNLSAAAIGSILVNNTDRAPVVTAPAAASGSGDSLITVSVTASDPDGEPITAFSADLSHFPTGHGATFTENASHDGGTLSWTPALDVPRGPHRVTFTATNALPGTASTDVSVDQPPVVTAPTSVTGTEGTEISFDIAAGDLNGDAITSLTADFTGLPAGHNAVFTPTLGNTGGRFTWTPSFIDSGGPYMVSFIVANALSRSSTVSIDVANVDRAPLISAPLDTTAPEGSTMSLIIAAADPDGQPITSFTADLSALPAGHNASFTTNAHQTSGTLTWTPTHADAGGPYDVTFTATNALHASSTTSITVSNTDRAPVVTAPLLVHGGESGVVTIEVTASDPDNQPISFLTADLAGFPPGNNAVFTTNATNTSGTLTWTPTFDDGRSAAYNVTFTAFNGMAGVSTTAVQVSDDNRAPVVAAPSSVAVNENSPITIDVAVSDPDGEAIGALTADLSAFPAGNLPVFTPHANATAGTLTWIPSFSDGRATSYDVTFIASNSSVGSRITAITVHNLDRLPVVTAPVSATVVENQPITIDVSAADPDGEPIASLSADLSVLPDGHGAVFTPGAGNTTGTLSWTPPPSAVRAAPYSIVFRALNALGGSSTTALHVQTDNLPPVAALSAAPSSGTAPLTVAADASGSSDDGSIVSFEFDFGDGTIVGPQPDPSASHTYATPGNRLLTVVVTDDDGARDTAFAVVRAIENLVTNASFEVNTTGWNANGPATITRVAGGHHGGFCLEIRGSSTSTFGTNDAPNWIRSVEAGARYRFSAWVRSAAHGGAAKFRVREYLSGSLQGGTNYSPAVTLSPEWQLLTYDYVALRTGSSLDFQVVETPRVSGEIFQVDEVGIRPVTTQPPVVGAPATLTVRENATVSFSLPVHDPDGEPIASLVADLSALPAGHDARFTVDPGNVSGTFTWTPGFADGRTAPYVLSFTATNDDVTVASTSIRVGNEDRAPIASAPLAVSGVEGQSLSIQVTASDPDGEPITELLADLSGLPPGHGAIFTPEPGNATGTLSWAPDFTHGGSAHDITFTARNALSGSSITTVTISDLDRAPVVTAPSMRSAIEEHAFTMRVIAADPDGQAIASWSVDPSDLPPGHDAVFTPDPDKSGGTFVWTPADGDSALGPFDVTFTASNGNSGSATTRIQLGSQDFAPVVTVVTSAVVAENQALTIEVAAADPNGEPIASLVADLSQLPANHGAVFAAEPGNTSGTLTWTPSFTQAGGPYAVTFTATNALIGSSATSVTVTNVDRPPVVIAPTNASVVEGQSLAIHVTASDPDGEPIASLTADPAGLPAGHSAIFTPGPGNATATLAWTPSALDVRASPYVVNFTASNVASGSAATSIMVLASNVAPVADLTATPSSGVAPLLVDFDASGSTDGDDGVVSYYFVFGDGATVGPQAQSSASHSYAEGVWNASVIVTDSRGGKDTALVVVDASQTNRVANPGFESDLGGWIPYSSATLSRVAGGHSGGFSLRAQGSSTSSFGIQESPMSITSVPAVGTVYRFSCWVRSDNSTRAVKIRVYELEGTTQIGTTFYSPEVTLSPAWKPIMVEYTTRRAGTSLRLRITNYPSVSNEAFLIDDIGVELVSVPPVPPIASLTVTPTSTVAPLVVTADASASSDPAGAVVSYRFDFGDGTTVGPQASSVANHTYAEAGMWNVRAIVTDDEGAQDTADVVVSAAPTVSGTNLVPNSGFEANTTGWAAQGSATLTRVAGGHSGGFALQMRGGSSITATFGIHDNPNVVATTAGVGRRYRFAAWVRSAVHTGRARLSVRELSGSTLRATTSSLAMTLRPEWQYLTVDHVVTVAGTTLDLQILNAPNATANETVLVDDVSIQLVPLGDQAPVVSAPSTISAVRGHVVTLAVTASDPDGSPIASLSADLSGLPDGHDAVFTVAPDHRAGTLTWTPSIADIRATPYIVTFTATNALSGAASTSIAVNDSAVTMNLVANPGFEVDLAGWGAYGRAALSRASGGRQGGFCLEARGPSTSSFGIDDVPNTVTNVPAVGTVYRFSCWIRSDNSTRAVKIRVYELQGTTQVGSTFYSPEVRLSPEWQLVTVDYAARRAGTSLSMRITDYPSVSGESFFVDDVSIEPVSSTLIASGERQSLEALAKKDADPRFSASVGPNPVRRAAVLRVTTTKAGTIRARLLDAQGRRVRTLIKKDWAGPGRHEAVFDGYDDRGARLPVGVYFYRIRTAEGVLRGKIVFSG